jgi:hypothetical protein
MFTDIFILCVSRLVLWKRWKTSMSSWREKHGHYPGLPFPWVPFTPCTIQILGKKRQPFNRYIQLASFRCMLYMHVILNDVFFYFLFWRVFNTRHEP